MSVFKFIKNRLFNRKDRDKYHDFSRDLYEHGVIDDDTIKELIKKKIPYVIIPHGSLSIKSQRHKYIKKKIGNFLIFNRFIKRANFIQCLSQRELLETKFDVQKFVVPNGNVRVDIITF